jgi:hypothetical protein
MSAPDNPEFVLPFELTPDGAAVLEQGSYEEIQQCVYALMRCEPGDLIDNPSFGVPSQLFLKGGADLDAIETAIVEQESRANVVIEADPDWFETLTETISIRRANG